MNDKSLISVKTLSKFFTELKKLFALKEHGTHLTLGTGSGNAYRGDRGNTAYNHSQAAHAPSDAQKNSDITKAEIEAKLTGAITTHTHSYAGSSSAGGAANSANKVNKSLSIQLNSGTATTFDGSTARSINITPGGIGAYTKNEVDVQLADLQGDIELSLGMLGNHEDEGHPDLYYTKTQSAGRATTGEAVDYTKTYNDSSTLTSATCGTGAEVFNDFTNNRAVGNYSHAEGSDAVASGNNSHAEGFRTRAVSGSSHAEGNQTKAGASYAHAEGYKTQASNTAAHAEGQSCIASGTQSHAEGMSTKAVGKYCHAEGYYTEAGEDKNTEGAHAEGYETYAYGEASHTEGCSTIAEGDYSHAEGFYTNAGGQCSHAEGEGTVAFGYAQHVEGIYNAPDEESMYIHIAGNGMDDTHRQNAYTLDWEGNAWFQGNVSSDMLPTDASHLTNKAYVDATCMSYVCCTSSQYNSLLENDMINENIIYFITE